MALLGSDFIASDPTDTSEVAQGPSWIRDIKQRLKDFVAVSFDPETGELLPDAVKGIPTPGDPGTVLTSTGPTTDPVWGAGPGIPVAAMFPFAGATVPSGYLSCDGSSKLISDFPALATALGTQFGGDGVSTFRVPDTRGRVLVGAGTGDATDATAWGVGDKKGSETVTLLANQLPEHTHSTDFNMFINGGGGHGGQDFLVNNVQTGDQAGTTVTATTFNEPSGTAHSNLQPSISATYIIKS